MSRLNSLARRSTKSEHMQICHIFASNPRNPKCEECSVQPVDCIRAFPHYLIKDILKHAPL